MSTKSFAIATIALCALVAIPLTASTAYRRMKAQRIQFNAAAAKAATQTTTQQDAETVTGLLFELRPAGFLPAETTVTAGKYFLMLQNHSGLRQLTFKLERVNEGRVASSNTQQRDWNAKVQLNAGTYVLREANHEEWRSVIHVTTPE